MSRRRDRAARTGLRLPTMMLWLTVLWVALWGSITWANVLGGVAVAVGVVLFARLDKAELLPTYFRPHWALWYVLVLGWKLLESNFRLAYEVLLPGDTTRTAIIAVPMRGGSDAVVNLVANSITLTPGTMTIDVKRHDHHHLVDGAVPAGVTLYVHGMFADDIEAVRHEVLQLESLALRAFGSHDDYERAKRAVIAHDAEMHDAPTDHRPNRGAES